MAPEAPPKDEITAESLGIARDLADPPAGVPTDQPPGKAALDPATNVFDQIMEGMPKVGDPIEGEAPEPESEKKEGEKAEPSATAKATADKPKTEEGEEGGETETEPAAGEGKAKIEFGGVMGDLELDADSPLVKQLQLVARELEQHRKVTGNLQNEHSDLLKRFADGSAQREPAAETPPPTDADIEKQFQEAMDADDPKAMVAIIDQRATAIAKKMNADLTQHILNLQAQQQTMRDETAAMPSTRRSRTRDVLVEFGDPNAALYTDADLDTIHAGALKEYPVLSAKFGDGITKAQINEFSRQAVVRAANGHTTTTKTTDPPEHNGKQLRSGTKPRRTPNRGGGAPPSPADKDVLVDPERTEPSYKSFGDIT